MRPFTLGIGMVWTRRNGSLSCASVSATKANSDSNTEIQIERDLFMADTPRAHCPSRTAHLHLMNAGWVWVLKFYLTISQNCRISSEFFASVPLLLLFGWPDSRKFSIEQQIVENFQRAGDEERHV